MPVPERKKRLEPGPSQMRCPCCGNDFTATTSTAHVMGIAHPPDDAGSIYIMAKAPAVESPPDDVSHLNYEYPPSYSWWQTICPECAREFVKAAQVPEVTSVLTDLMGWYVRQAIQLHDAITMVKDKLKEMAEAEGAGPAASDDDTGE